MTSETLITQAIQAAKSGNRAEARRILAQIVRDEPQNARAWYLLSQVVESNDQAIFSLNKVLQIDPGNPQALERLAKLGVAAPAAPLPQATPQPPSPSDDQLSPESGENESEKTPWQVDSYIIPPTTEPAPSEPISPAPSEDKSPPPWEEEQPKPKRSTAMTVLLVILGLFAACCLCVGLGSIVLRDVITRTFSNIAPEFDPSQVNPSISHSVTYRIEGAGSANITYATHEGDAQQALNATLPWRLSATLPEGTLLMVVGQSSQPGSKLTCIIEVDGKEWIKQDSIPGLGIATCTGYLGMQP